MSYNPDQERDERGRFSAGGKSGGELRREARRQKAEGYGKGRVPSIGSLLDRAGVGTRMRWKAAEDYGRARYGMGRGSPDYGTFSTKSGVGRSFTKGQDHLPGIFGGGRRIAGAGIDRPFKYGKRR